MHGTVQSKDNSDYSGPVTAAGPFTFATSQTINEKPDNTGVAQMLLTSMLGASKNGGLRSMADQASVLLGFSLADSNPVSVITDKRPDGSTLLWTSTIRNVIVYKVSPEAPGTLQEVAKYDHGYNFRFHGSYAFVGEVNGQSHFFTTDNDSLVSYTLVEEGGRKGGYSIKPLGKLALPVWTNPSGADHLVGVTVLDDGTVVVCSKTGVLMASRADGKGGFVLMDTLALGDFTRTSNNEVSNSISADGQGIFIVTQREVCRVDFNPATGRLGFKWSTIYGPEAPWYIGRLGPGAGSTPSISECGGRKTIVITDGAMPMNVLWYDAEKGVLAGSRKVQFTEDENGNLPTQSEQSVAVDGCKAFVVQNYMGMTELDDSVFCTTVRTRVERGRGGPGVAVKLRGGEGSGSSHGGLDLPRIMVHLLRPCLCPCPHPLRLPKAALSASRSPRFATSFSRTTALTCSFLVPVPRPWGATPRAWRCTRWTLMPWRATARTRSAGHGRAWTSRAGPASPLSPREATRPTASARRRGPVSGRCWGWTWTRGRTSLATSSTRNLGRATSSSTPSMLAWRPLGTMRS